MAESRLTTLKVNEISLVDAPAVKAAKFLIAKRATTEPDVTLEALEKRVVALEVVEPKPVNSLEEVLSVEDLARLQAMNETLNAPKP